MSRRSGIALTAILRLRRGEATDIRLTTLEKLALGLQVRPAELIDDPQLVVPPAPPSRSIDPRLVRGLIKKARAFVTVVERYAMSLGDDESSVPAPHGRGRRGKRGKKREGTGG